VAWAESDGDYTRFGLGVRARLPFRIFTLPGRLVIEPPTRVVDLVRPSFGLSARPRSSRRQSTSAQAMLPEHFMA
jgi:hypothetical protein